MIEFDAKKIGSRLGLISAIAGIIIAQLIMTSLMTLDMGLMKAFFWFLKVDYKMNLFTGILILLICSYYFGKLAGKAILINNWNSMFTGALCGLVVLLLTAFLSGWLGFIQEGIDNVGTEDNPFEDYIFKPFYWVTIFGSIPSILVGIWFGRQISKERLKDRNMSSAHNSAKA